MGVSGGGKNKTIVFSFRFSVLGKAKNLMKTENRKPKTENRKPKTENYLYPYSASIHPQTRMLSPRSAKN